MGKDMKKPFIVEETQIHNKHMKIYLISPIIREMQIKIIRYHFLFNELEKIINSNNIKYWHGYGEISSFGAGENVNWYRYFVQQFDNNY